MSAGFGEQITRAVTLCTRCEEHPYRYPGKLCGVCWREINGIVFEPAPVVVAAPPSPPPMKPEPKVGRGRYPGDKNAERTRKRREVLGCGPLPQSQVDVLWAARVKPPAPRCRWPGCERPHAMRGGCYMHIRRVDSMGGRGTEPETWPAQWEAYQVVLGDVYAANGAARKGLPTKARRKAVRVVDVVRA